MPLDLPAGHYDLDPAHSRLGFAVRHAMVTTVRGAFSDVTGSADLDPAGTSSVYVEIAAASVDTRQPDRDAHLRGADFLDAERFPTLVFAASEVEFTETAVRLAGELTIRDVTRPLEVVLEFVGRVRDPFGNDRVGLEGSVVVDRREWGLTWNAALEAGGVLVANRVTLEFEVAAVRRPDVAGLEADHTDAGGLADAA